MAIKLLISKKMDERGMSVSEFAESARIAYNTALSLKRGSSTRIDFDTLEKICLLFGCEPGDLIVLEKQSERSE
jgi:putative transcriptional regulator